jgi:hypothetical protein
VELLLRVAAPLPLLEADTEELLQALPETEPQALPLRLGVLEPL